MCNFRITFFFPLFLLFQLNVFFSVLLNCKKKSKVFNTHKNNWCQLIAFCVVHFFFSGGMILIYTHNTIKLFKATHFICGYTQLNKWWIEVSTCKELLWKRRKRKKNQSKTKKNHQLLSTKEIAKKRKKKKETYKIFYDFCNNSYILTFFFKCCVSFGVLGDWVSEMFVCVLVCTCVLMLILTQSTYECRILRKYLQSICLRRCAEANDVNLLLKRNRRRKNYIDTKPICSSEWSILLREKKKQLCVLVRFASCDHCCALDSIINVVITAEMS